MKWRTLGVISDERARQALSTAFQNLFSRSGSRCELQIAQAVSVGESHYGTACYRNQVTGTSVCDSNNWGAEQCGSRPPCPGSCFEATDTHENGEPYQACFKRHATPEEGAREFLKALYINQGRATVLAAAGRGDVPGVSTAMRASGYFELPLAQHKKVLAHNVDVVAKSLGEPSCNLGGGSASDTIPLFVKLGLFGGVVYAGWRYFT